MDLASLIVEFRGNLTPLERDMDRALQSGVAKGGRLGERTGKAYSDGVRSGIRDLATGGGLTSVLGNIGGGTLSGTVGAGILRSVVDIGTRMSQTASQTQRFRQQLSDIAGDAKRGERALASLQKTAADSVFNTGQVVGLGATIAGRTGDVTQGAAEAQKIVDASAALYIGNDGFGEFQKNLVGMLAKQTGKVDKVDIDQMRRYAPGVAGAIGKANGMSTQKANELLDTGTGRQIYDAILKVGDANAGKAKLASISTPGEAVSSIFDQLEQAAGKTGERINNGIIGPLRSIVTVTGYVKDFNDATGGNAGLVAMLGAGTLGMKLLVDGGRKAYTGIVTLTSAIERLATMSEAAAASVGRQTVVRPFSAGAPGATIGAPLAIDGSGVAGPARPGPNFGWQSVAALPSFLRYGKEGMKDWSRLHLGEGVGQGLLNQGLSLGKGVAMIGAPIAAQYAGGKLQESDNPATAWAGGALTAAGTGAGIGGMIGMFVPGAAPLGMAAGALAGLAIDTGQRLYERSHPDAGGKTGAEERTAKAAESMDATLKDIKTKQIGGGERTRYAMSTVEREFALFQTMRAQATGFH